MEKIRRKPEAILKSFEMDPKKKAVYVEGQTDRLFFEYLFDNHLFEETIFLEIDTVDLPNIENGGNKQRLLFFGSQIEKSSAEIKCFVDADFSRILKEQVPETVILTDFRDLESYLYQKDYLNKFVKIGLRTDKITPDIILNELSNVRDIAMLRLCSHINNFNLPFEKTNINFQRYYKYGDGLNFKKYLDALIQNCIDKVDFHDIKNAFVECKKKYGFIKDKDLIHGKDAIKVIGEIAKSLKYKKDNVELVFWMSFEKSDINQYPALTEVENFIQQ